MAEPTFVDLEPWGYGTENETPVLVFGLGVAVPAIATAILAIAALRAWWLARQAARVESAADTSSLRPGTAVIRGVVDGAEGDVVVQVTIDQRGEERRSKNGHWRTHWREVARHVVAQPFDVVRGDGSRLRVEPGEAPRLLDALSEWSPAGGDLRRATATLTAGETVVARGTIEATTDARGGYRGASALVLRARRGEPMLLSTLGLAAVSRAAARRRAWWMAAVAVSIPVAQLLAVPYHAAVFAGETREATVVAQRIREDSRAHHDDDYFIRYAVDGVGEPIEDQVAPEDYARLPVGTVVPVRVSPIETTLGPHPTLDGELAFWLLLVVPFSVLTVWMGLRRRGWYERRLDDSTPGRLHGGA